MSDEKPKEPIKDGDQVVIQKPSKPPSEKGGGCAPGLIILIFVIGMFLLLWSPDQSSPPASPASTATGTPGPTLTEEPLERTPAASYPCEEGIAVGKSADVVYESVRVRKSAGYLTKNDDQDTIHYLETGDTVSVKAGPTEKDGLCWWKIAHEGVEGWTADHSNEGKLLLKAGQ